MADIFLSYARQNQDDAGRIAAALEAEGYDVFWDMEIPAGISWADFLQEKLDTSHAAVVLWSEASVRSEYVREEARLARNVKKLIPVSLDGAPPPFGFGEIQTADLTGWSGDRADAKWRALLDAIQRKIGAPSGPRPQRPPPPPLKPPTETGGGWRGANTTQTTVAKPGLPPAVRYGAIGAVGLLALVGAFALFGGGGGIDPGAQTELGGFESAVQTTTPFGAADSQASTTAPVEVAPAVQETLQRARAAQAEARAATERAQAAATAGMQAFALAQQGAAGHGAIPINSVIMMSGDLAGFQAGRAAGMVMTNQTGETFSGWVTANASATGIGRVDGVTETPWGVVSSGFVDYESVNSARSVGSTRSQAWLFEGTSTGTPGQFLTRNLGVISFSDGARYEGEFDARGEREITLSPHGHGAVYDARGVLIQAGRFENDRYVGAQ